MLVLAHELRQMIYPVFMPAYDDFFDRFDKGERVVYYRGELISSAASHSSAVRRFSKDVWSYVIEEGRGTICHKRLTSHADGINEHEYWAIPSPSREITFKR